MSVCLACWLLIAWVCSTRLGWADEPAGSSSPAPDSSPSAVEDAGQSPSRLEQHLDALDQVDRGLAQAQEQLARSHDPEARRQLKARIQALQATQEQLLQGLEQLVGPLPPTVRHEPPIALEEQLKAQQRHHEAILESDVDRRLPAK